MAGSFFLGGMVMVLIVVIAIIVFLIVMINKAKRKVRGFSRLAFGTDSLTQGLQQAQLESQNTPKSLSGLDTIVLPRIKKDFPDFNIDVAESHVRKELLEHMRDKNSPKVHNIVLRDYKRHKYESVIVMQASAEYIVNSTKKQVRYNINYIYSLVENGEYDNKLSAVCPNCGAPVSDTSLGACEYCGSALVDIIERSWIVKDIIEC